MTLPPSTGPGSRPPARELLAAALEHTLLRPETTAKDIERLCTEALQHHFHCVCVNSSRVQQAYHLVQDSGVKVASTVGFPLGASEPDAKRYETEIAIDQGAHEIDVVMNIGRFKDGDHSYIVRELRDVVEAADERPVKVIIETCLLTREEKITACKLVLDSGAQVVKTSTGFSTGGATVEDVRLLRETVGTRFGVKAAGGIRNFQQALAMLEAGANRLGTSAAVAIISELGNSEKRT
jgi:deoxyribose-phosphate aldolase